MALPDKMNTKEFLEGSIVYLDKLKAPAMEEAQRLFPSHPKAQDVWAKLVSHSGGVAETVKVLGLEADYDE